VWRSEAREALGDGFLAYQAVELFDWILTARNRLEAVLPGDDQTPRTIEGGRAIFEPMLTVYVAMGAFTRYAEKVGQLQITSGHGRRRRKQGSTVWAEEHAAWGEHAQEWW
jgi:hypothetical protein